MNDAHLSPCFCIAFRRFWKAGMLRDILYFWVLTSTGLTSVLFEIRRDHLYFEYAFGTTLEDAINSIAKLRSPLSNAPLIPGANPAYFDSHAPCSPCIFRSLNTDSKAHTVNLRPLLGAPIAQTSHTLHTVPLYLVWYLIPSNGQAWLASPA